MSFPAFEHGTFGGSHSGWLPSHYTAWQAFRPWVYTYRLSQNSWNKFFREVEKINSEHVHIDHQGHNPLLQSHLQGVSLKEKLRVFFATLITVRNLCHKTFINDRFMLSMMIHEKYNKCRVIQQVMFQAPFNYHHPDFVNNFKRTNILIKFLTNLLFSIWQVRILWHMLVWYDHLLSYTTKQGVRYFSNIMTVSLSPTEFLCISRISPDVLTFQRNKNKIFENFVRKSSLMALCS